MVCPNCRSSDLKKASLLHAAGFYQSRGRIGGFFLGNRAGLPFGRYRGTSQSRLSAMAGPPGKLPYLTPVIIWLAGFFVVMAFGWPQQGFLDDGLGRRVYLYASRITFWQGLLYTSPSAQKSTGGGKARYCASAAGYSLEKQFLEPLTRNEAQAPFVDAVSECFSDKPVADAVRWFIIKLAHRAFDSSSSVA